MCRDGPGAFVEQMPVESLPAFLTVVGLYLLGLERWRRENMISELDRDLLVVARVGTQHSDASVVIDGGVLMEAFLLSGLAGRLDEIHVHLQLMAGQLLLVTLPSGLVLL